MSTIINMQQFAERTKPVDPKTQARLDFAIRMLSGNLDISVVEDLPTFIETCGQMRDALDDIINDCMFELRYRGTSQYDRKRILQQTCPLLAAIYRAEAIADQRIDNDQHAHAKLDTVHDLMVQAIEERMGGEFSNPIYPTEEKHESNAKRWRRFKTERTI